MNGDFDRRLVLKRLPIMSKKWASVVDVIIFYKYII